MSFPIRPLALCLVLAAGCGDDSGDPPSADAPMNVADARPADAPPSALDCSTETGDHPTKLGCTGLYSDWATKTIAPTARMFKPGFELWSDGASKVRWIQLPPGTTVDVSDPDEWTFPVGTKVWKEFRVNGKPIETRLLWKRGGGWLRTTYVWSADGVSAADEVTGGVPDVPGTGGYSVPATTLCFGCHGGRLDELLGFEAVLLAAPEAQGLTYTALQQQNLLSSTNGRHTITAAALAIPGSTVERNALGMLHANCGVACHNPIGQGGRFDSKLQIGDDGTLGPVLETPTVTTMVNQRSTYRPEDAPSGTIFHRLRPLDVGNSVAIERMNKRGLNQMPPFATNKVDDAGVAALSAWVGAMTEANGYPPPASTGN